jgi:hypothetical protein
MSTRMTPRRPRAAARRFGYLVAILVNGGLLYAANVWPGWEAVPFLTSETRQVLGLVNASILVSVAANLVYLVNDPRWLKALGDIVTTGVGIAALVRIRAVFPFAFTDTTLDWDLVANVLLVVGIVGSAIGIVVALVTFVRGVAAPPD